MRFERILIPIMESAYVLNVPLLLDIIMIEIKILEVFRNVFEIYPV